MNERLLANDYDAIATKIKTLSQDIQYISRQSDLIGGLDDTPTFRNKLTSKIQTTSKLVMNIKNQLQNAKNTSGTDSKWKKLESQFFTNFERLRDATTNISTKFKDTEPHKQPSSSSKQKDSLLSSNNNGYGTTESNNYGQSQDQMFRPYDDVYELENYEEQLFEILQNLQLLYESHKDLNLMFYDQDEVVEQLHDNVEEARDQVQSGVQHLDKAASHQKAYRGKLCIFLAVLLVIAIIVTLIVVLGNRK